MEKVDARPIVDVAAPIHDSNGIGSWFGTWAAWRRVGAIEPVYVSEMKLRSAKNTMSNLPRSHTRAMCW
jgi:hypothetical protein